MAKLDFTTAKLRHLNWRDRLRKFLDGTEQVTEAEMSSPKDCDLGKWLYAEGMTKYGAFREMKELEAVHREMHALVKTIVLKKNAGDKAGSEESYKKLVASSDKIVELLSAVQKKAA